MVAKDTIEEKVMALKERKAALTASVLDGDDLACAALTADDIRSLLS
jgi:SNF2 family DNA or RNA helicase